MRDYLRAACALLCATAVAGVAYAAPSDYVGIFTANDGAFQTYLDTNNQSTDGSGYKLVDTKTNGFSDGFRTWIGKNFPGAETADYDIDRYVIDCSKKTIVERHIEFFSADGRSLASRDYDGRMAQPYEGTLKFAVVSKSCGS